MKRLFLVISVVMVASILSAAYISAAVPHLIRFQGKVTDTAGAPLNGAYNITFRIYNAETGGALLWSETQSAVPVNNGIFTVLLGNVADDLNLPFDEPYWLSMEVNNDGEMAPRQAITSVGYAIHAEVADSIAGVSVVPQGAIIMLKEPHATADGCPVGYTRVGELDGKFIAAGATYNPAAGGSNTHDHGAGSYEVSSHTHSVPNSGWPNTVRYGAPGLLSCGKTSERFETTAGNHTTGSTSPSVLGTSGQADSRPEFATVIFCEKD